jgi:hypothetical protein
MCFVLSADLSYATAFLKQLEDQVEAYYRSHVVTKETVSLRNAIQTVRGGTHLGLSVFST